MPPAYKAVRYFKIDSGNIVADMAARFLMDQKKPQNPQDILNHVAVKTIFKHMGTKRMINYTRILLKDQPDGLTATEISKSYSSTRRHGTTALVVSNSLSRHPGFNVIKAKDKNGSAKYDGSTFFLNPRFMYESKELIDILFVDPYNRFEFENGLVFLDIWTSVCAWEKCDNMVQPRNAQTQASKKRFCSKDCSNKSIVVEKVKFICDNCGKENEVLPGEYNKKVRRSVSGKIFCNTDCSSPYNLISARMHSQGKKNMKETVNHPDHYGGEKNPYEAIKVMTAWSKDWDPEAVVSLSPCLKYISRHHLKGKPLEDLKKARWYLDNEIKRLENAARQAKGLEKQG